jgi:cell shape-determining protein MreC
MTYLQKSKKKKKFLNKRNILILVVLLILLFGTSIKNITNFVAKPVVLIKETVFSPFENIFNHFQFKQNLIDENSELIEENKKLNIELLTINSLRKENQELKDLFVYQEKKPELILSKILNHNNYSPFDTFTVDSGSNQGIKAGSLVSYLNVPIGTVSEVYLTTSVVSLYSFPDKRISVSFYGGTTAEAVGLGAGSFVVVLPKDIKVSEGDIVNAFNFPIGVIKSIVVDHSGTFQNVYFNYPFNLNEIEFVQIDTTPAQNLEN